MDETLALLATLAQSSAAIVAIVGGFLVSRLVQLSSEREGLRRRLSHAHDELSHVTASYLEAHDARLTNSRRQFFSWVVDQLAEADDLDGLNRDAVLDDNIPLGSSTAEMAPYLEQLIIEVAEARRQIDSYVLKGDDSTLDLDDLQDRGLEINAADTELYQSVIDHVASTLPDPRGRYGPVLRPGQIQSAPVVTAEIRRLDESIRQEQDLHSRKALLNTEVARLADELERIGRPTGVALGIAILCLYSILGIMAPVMVMAPGPWPMPNWAPWLLVGLFALGLFSVLIYIWWYASTLNNPIDDIHAKAHNSLEEASRRTPEGGAAP